MDTGFTPCPCPYPRHVSRIFSWPCPHHVFPKTSCPCHVQLTLIGVTRVQTEFEKMNHLHFQFINQINPFWQILENSSNFPEISPRLWSISSAGQQSGLKSFTDIPLEATAFYSGCPRDSFYGVINRFFSIYSLL